MLFGFSSDCCGMSTMYIYKHLQVTTVSPEHSAKEHLEKEARKWASKVAKENKSIKENTRQLNILQTQGATERKVITHFVVFPCRPTVGKWTNRAVICNTNTSEN